jgi:ribosomal-protein-alanine N-acetyltransferase
MDYTFEQLAGKIRLAYLEVRVTNQPALNLYKKRGFLIVGLCKHYYPDGEDAILMTLDLDEGSKPGYY